MSVTDFWQWRATTRLRKTAAWDTLQFAANGSIFVLMGEQIPVLVSAAPLTVQSTPHQNPWWLVLYVVVIVFMLAMLRFAWVWATLRAMIFSARRAVPCHPRRAGAWCWRQHSPACAGLSRWLVC